ncbi:metallophosphoesterase family protein [Aquamicrobium zhengzhouense]|uniref:hypothetical protein n=1 Tax=Aquamicrobium zhengzhouense TaxID=2781738 RepID=UPI001AEE9285|nr:hypothetical protein [Aquamicrobium zhengzhouense]
MFAGNLKGDLTGRLLVSDLSSLIKAGRPDLWVHGHVHDTFDYRVGSTRVVANPKGYRNENPLFDPAMVIDV